MKKIIGKLIVAIYPAISLIILPIVNYLLTDQLRTNHKIFTLSPFYHILIWLSLSVLFFTYIFNNLNILDKYSILSGLIISAFFIICALIPLPLMVDLIKFYRIFMTEFLTNFYLACFIFSLYLVLLLTFCAKDYKFTNS